MSGSRLPSSSWASGFRQSTTLSGVGRSEAGLRVRVSTPWFAGNASAWATASSRHGRTGEVGRLFPGDLGAAQHTCLNESESNRLDQNDGIDSAADHSDNKRKQIV